LFSNVLLADSPFFSFKEVDSYLTKKAENSIGLDFNEERLEYLMDRNNIEFFVDFPTLDKKFIKTSVKRFSVVSETHNLLIQNNTKQFKEDYKSGIHSFKINYKDEIIGVLLVLNNKIISSYKLNGRQIELNYFNSDYVLFDVNDVIREKTFSCAVEQELEQIISPENNSHNSSSMTPLCLELAIEVDQFTRNTFSSNSNAADWAHAIIAGVSQVYYSEVGINVSISNTIIWNSQDPYANITNDAGTMLDSLRTYWNTNNSSISRDLVHLLTKRGNTGTGGIAYLDVLCSNSWGYAFSSVLDNDTSFCSCPTYTWNLFVCSHEIGHNIGANHTHWCGWTPEPWNGFNGGPIDNCVDVQGSCSNNPAPQVGTIMSYCHTTSSGALIDFDDIVISQALNPGINGASCLTICSFYGCTDSNAINYDPSATIDDSTCIYPNILLSSNISMPDCFGESTGSIDLIVNGGQSPYSFLWSNGETTEDIFSVNSDTFSVTVTDAQGWVAFSSFFVSQPDTFYTIVNILNTSDSSSSNGAIFINVLGGSSPYTYYWNDGTSFFPDTTPYLINIPFGSYNLYVVDDNSCFQSLVIDVGVDCVYGCTDPLANNYNPLAGCDDGSCSYSNCTNPVPSGLVVNWTTDTKASVSWDNMNDTACMVFKYFIRYRVYNLDGTYGSWVTKSAGVGNGLCNFGLNTTEKRLQLLTAATTYQFKMKAFYCGGTESGYSQPATFTTGADCPPMTNLGVQTFNGNQAKATFSWDTTGAYVFARIALRVDTTGATWGTAGGFGVYFPTLTTTKFGLTPGQSYRAQGRTFCDSNVTSYRSTWTTPITWTQPGTLPIRFEGGNTINNLDVYPNPSRDIFNVTFVSEDIQDLEVKVINVVGEVVYTEALEQFVGEYTKQIDLTDNSKGVYFLEITTNNGVVNKKLIIQ
jgi:hypothetical protein